MSQRDKKTGKYKYLPLTDVEVEVLLRKAEETKGKDFTYSITVDKEFAPVDKEGKYHLSYQLVARDLSPEQANFIDNLLKLYPRILLHLKSEAGSAGIEPPESTGDITKDALRKNISILRDRIHTLSKTILAREGYIATLQGFREIADYQLMHAKVQAQAWEVAVRSHFEADAVVNHLVTKQKEIYRRLMGGEDPLED